MYICRLLSVIAVFLILSDVTIAETKFKVGQTYSGFIQLDNDSKDMQISLPKGDWIVSAVNTGSPNSSGTILVTVHLMNAVNKRLKGAIYFRYAYLNHTSGWKAPTAECGSQYNFICQG